MMKKVKMNSIKPCLVMALSVLISISVGCAKKIPANSTTGGGKPEKPVGQGWNCVLKAKNLGPCIHWSFDTLPTPSADGSMTIELYALDSRSSRPAPFPISSDIQLRIFLLLPDKTHQSDKTPVVKALSSSKFFAEQVHFNESGLWQISFLFEQNGRPIDLAEDNYAY